MIPFPKIPDRLLDGRLTIEPCDEVAAWARAMFLAPGGPLFNPDHAHLVGAEADIAFLWTNCENSKGGKRIIGTAQVGQPMGGTPWAKMRAVEQLLRWFDRIPDFIITLDATYLKEASAGAICALVEHELYHCAQAKDRFGEDRFDRYGEPIWAIRPHDVEEFTGVVKRYGAAAAQIEAFAEAIKKGPIFKGADLGGICGVCHG